MSSSNEGSQVPAPGRVLGFSEWLNGDSRGASIHADAEAREFAAKGYEALGQPEMAAKIRGEVYESSFINNLKAFGKKSVTYGGAAKGIGYVVGGAALLVGGTE